MATKKPDRSPKPSLDRLYFGKDDAESDFARGGLLRQGFMRTRAYDEAFTGSKTLIIGRKGRLVGWVVREFSGVAAL